MVQLLLSNQRTANIAAPVSGNVVSFNEDLALDPMLLCKAPYTRGWICEISPSGGMSELAALPFLHTSIQYFQLVREEPVTTWMAAEVEKLRNLLAGCLPDALTEENGLDVNLSEVLSEED